MERNSVLSSFIIGAFVCLGLLGAGYFVSGVMVKGRQAVNFVTVKGFSERDVKADVALWQMSFNVASNDIAEVTSRAKTHAGLITDFVKSKGLSLGDVRSENIKLTDKLADEYATAGSPAPASRYIIKQVITLRTADVDKVDAAQRAMSELVKQGVALTANTVDYQYTRLNDVKPDMLREATQSARKGAEQFANDAGSKVGAIKEASQGYFSVVSADFANKSTEDNGGVVEQFSTINKKVRVVISVTYMLNK